jgi:hypothetical protein
MPKRIAQLVAWLQKTRLHYIVLAAVVLVVVSAGVASVKLLRNNQPLGSSDAPTQQTQAESVSLYIESTIPGVVMAGSPYCDGAQSNKTTPYACELQKDQSETTITAPAEAAHEGKTYTFKSWDGCSEGNADWKICKVKIDGVSSKNIVATYELKVAAQPQPQKPAPKPVTPNKAPTCTKEDVADPTYASCEFTLTDTPAKTIIDIRLYASECGKNIQGGLGLTHPAPCKKEHAGYANSYEPDPVSVITCGIPGACAIGLEISSHNSKQVTAKTPTSMTLKVQREAKLYTRTYCRYGCAQQQAWFDEWEYTYNAATKTFIMSAFYLYKGI